MTRVAIFVSGGGSNMVSLVNAMQSGQVPATPALVFSNRADAGGISKATNLGVRSATVDHRPFGENRTAFETEVSAILAAEKIDLICLAGFMRVLTAGFTDAWSGRMLNIHPSLLPKYRGLNTHRRALDAGDAEAGCTVHEVTSELDEGPILGQRRVPVLADDTAETLAARVLIEEHRLYPEMLTKFLST